MDCHSLKEHQTYWLWVVKMSTPKVSLTVTGKIVAQVIFRSAVSSVLKWGQRNQPLYLKLRSDLLARSLILLGHQFSVYNSFILDIKVYLTAPQIWTVDKWLCGNLPFVVWTMDPSTLCCRRRSTPLIRLFYFCITHIDYIGLEYNLTFWTVKDNILRWWWC